MFSLTSREQFLVVGIIAAVVAGVAVEHWRDARREVPGQILAPVSGDVQTASTHVVHQAQLP